MGVLHQVVVHCAAHAESAMVLSRACGAFVGRRLGQVRGGATDGAHRGKSRDRTFSSAGLDDEDILASHALLDLNARLAALELVEQHLGRRYAEVVADGPARGQLTAPFTFTGATYSVSCGCELPPRTTMLRTMATGWWWGESSFQSLDGEQTGNLEKARKTLVDSLGPSRRGRWGAMYSSGIGKHGECSSGASMAAGSFPDRPRVASFAEPSYEHEIAATTTAVSTVTATVSQFMHSCRPCSCMLFAFAILQNSRLSRHAHSIVNEAHM
jgi:hypothetical protein